MKNSPDLRQLAASLHLSVSQVSRALSNKGRVSPATRDLVLTAARRSGYCNRSPRHRRQLAVVFDSMHYGMRDFISALEMELVRHDWNAVWLNATGIALLKEFAADAVLAVDVTDAILSDLAAIGGRTPVSLRIFTAGSFDVSWDQEEVIASAASFFRERGHGKPLALFPSRDEVVEIPDGGIRRWAIPPDALGAFLAEPATREYDALLSFLPLRPAAQIALVAAQRPGMGLAWLADGAGYPAAPAALGPILPLHSPYSELSKQAAAALQMSLE